MKKIFLFSMVLFLVFWTSCNKEPGASPNKVELLDGAIVFNYKPNVKITQTNESLQGRSGMFKSSVKSSFDNTNPIDYQFTKIGEVGTLKVGNVVTQASHVDIVPYNGYYVAFVSYMDVGTAHVGGVLRYKVTLNADGTKADVDENVEGIEMPRAEFSSVFYRDNKLYVAGASSEPMFSYNEITDRYNYAFFMVLDLNPNLTFKQVEPKVVKLGSFQATSIRAANGRIYVTTGDGEAGTDGGLYIFDANTLERLNFIPAKHARSVDIDEYGNMYLLQAQSTAEVTKFDAGGNVLIARDVGRVRKQEDAKSEILFWKDAKGDFLFTAENKGGLRMLYAEDFFLNDAIDAPDKDSENEVTNSVNINSDRKRDKTGKWIEGANLLLVANGEAGVYWYDVIWDEDEGWSNYKFMRVEENSILGGTSANFIASSENIVFVADGLGGLKILYMNVTVNNYEEPICPDCCEDDLDCPEGYICVDGECVPENDDPCKYAFGFNNETFMKDNGESRFKFPDPPIDRKSGDLTFSTVGDYMVVEITPRPGIKYNHPAVIFAIAPNPPLTEANVMDAFNTVSNDAVNNGGLNSSKMTYTRNSPFVSQNNSGKWTFKIPKSHLLSVLELPADANLGDYQLLAAVSYEGGWGYGIPQGPAGSTGGGTPNNSQYINLGNVNFCP